MNKLYNVLVNFQFKDGSVHAGRLWLANLTTLKDANESAWQAVEGNRSYVLCAWIEAVPENKQPKGAKK